MCVNSMSAEVHCSEYMNFPYPYHTTPILPVPTLLTHLAPSAGSARRSFRLFSNPVFRFLNLLDLLDFLDCPQGRPGVKIAFNDS